MWQDLVIIHGKPRHPQSQGSVERSNADIHDMILAWLLDNDSTKWSVGLKFVQLQKNSSLNIGIGRSPYEALFGKTATIGLSSSAALPKEVLDNLEREEDLICLTSKRPLSVSEESELDSEQSECEEQVPDQDRGASVGDVTAESVTLECSSETGTTDVADKPQQICVVCTLETSGAHSCGKCNTSIHIICGKEIVNSEEGFGSKVLCPHCFLDTRCICRPSGAKERQDKQAASMVNRSKKLLGTPEVGQTVAVPIPMYDRGKGDSKNLLRRIAEVDEHGLSRIATKYGELKGKYGSNEFSVCKKTLLSENDTSHETSLSVREAANKQSISSSQGFQRCSCTTKCNTNRCKCRKMGKLCNSRCHSSNTCDNK